MADITDLEAFRQAYKGRVEQAGGKLTMTAILVKIVASTLKRHPTLNAAVDMANHEIVYRDSINIGVAVDTERGPFRKFLKAGEAPEAEFQIKEEVLGAREFCNVHGLWTAKK